MGTADFGPGMRRARPTKIYPSPHRHNQLMSTGRYTDLPSRLPLFLDRDHFRSCLKPRGSIPQVDYHALISERENCHLAGLFCPGWSWENGHFICHGSPRYLSRRADRYRHSFGRLPPALVCTVQISLDVPPKQSHECRDCGNYRQRTNQTHDYARARSTHGRFRAGRIG